MKLTKHLVEKPWGRTDIPAAFGEMAGRRIGEIWYESDGPDPLPLLIKWLFTSEKLSIQVHPSDEEAAARGLPSGKEECWFIVDAQPGAALGIGTIRPLSAKELRAASLSGEIEGLIDWKPVKPGDYFYIPVGTVHAIGAGITLVEVQQYADITYRLYDYGRPRELHLDDGVAVSTAGPYGDARSGTSNDSTRLVDGPYFWLDFVVGSNMPTSPPAAGPFWVTPVKGEVMIAGESLKVGDCGLLDSLDLLRAAPQSAMLIAGIATN